MNNEAEKMFEAIRENELEAAQEHFNDSLREAYVAQDIEGLAEFAESLHQAGFLEEARDAYLLLKEMAPQFEEWDLFLAEISIDQNRVEEGLDILLQFDQSSELYPNVLMTLADAYQTMGLYEVSEHKLMEALKILPDEPVLLYALAKLYHTSGKYQQATTLYEQLLNHETKEMWSENLYILLADCHNITGEFEKAISYLEQVDQSDHTSDSLFQLGVSYLQIKEYTRASQVLQDLVSKDPDYMSAYLYLSLALEENLQLEEALDVMLEGIESDPYQAAFYVSAAKLYVRLNQPLEAEKQLQRALELEPELMEALLLKIDLMMDQGRFQEVVDLFEGEQKELLHQPAYEWKVAQAHNQLEEFEIAATYYDRAYQELNDDFDFLTDYSQFLIEEGNQQKLAEVVTRALMIDPDDFYFNEVKEDRLMNE
ncbi:tetratricopeptide repeat protein [Jeotgalibaca caeni]|uniref:tetratricopeptide repeat protein n=1 Tax=Jeotgalibaca caeni TaxID=3028623 RepID=UPI00237EAFE4|nr:tetratricopeptide repeat protein [Jeotgalibaca caeni]MDE1549362.1 tetratricopeptide repeat protein [Jeotgalibaca caeni]